MGAKTLQTSLPIILFPLQFIGRIDCNGPLHRGPVRDMPPSDLTTSQLLHFFSCNFDFNAQETVTIMGANTIGVAQRTNSGFAGELGWVRDSISLDNEYYQMLIGVGNKRSDFY